MRSGEPILQILISDGFFNLSKADVFHKELVGPSWMIMLIFEGDCEGIHLN